MTNTPLGPGARIAETRLMRLDDAEHQGDVEREVSRRRALAVDQWKPMRLLS